MIFVTWSLTCLMLVMRAALSAISCHAIDRKRSLFHRRTFASRTRCRLHRQSLIIRSIELRSLKSRNAASSNARTTQSRIRAKRSILNHRTGDGRDCQRQHYFTMPGTSALAWVDRENNRPSKSPLAAFSPTRSYLKKQSLVLKGRAALL
jgi:hypothetical protein